MKNRKKIFQLLPVIILAAGMISCDSSNNDNQIPEPDLYRIGEFTDNGVTVTAYSVIPAFVGYNKIYLDVRSEGEQPEFLDIEFLPVMHMEAHSHSSPVEPPGPLRSGEFNLFDAAVVFTMPSGMMGSWELQIIVREGSQPDILAEGTIDVDVEESNRVISFMTEDESRYILTWVRPVDPQTGSNDLVVTLHERESMMSFPPVTDADIEFEPWMPSMDHGSSNNVDPVHGSNGHYSGTVNFNMTGDWELRFDITRNGDDLGHHVFELDF
jgi:hypothetical protein